MCNTTTFNSEFYQLVQLNKPRYDEFVLNNILRKYEDSVSRLLPCHPELNPIDLIWAKMKNYRTVVNICTKIDTFKEMVEEEMV